MGTFVRMIDAKTIFVKWDMLMTDRLQPILLNFKALKGMFAKEKIWIFQRIRESRSLYMNLSWTIEFKQALGVPNWGPKIFGNWTWLLHLLTSYLDIFSGDFIKLAQVRSRLYSFWKTLTNVLLQKKIMIVMLPNMTIQIILVFINVFPRMPHVEIRLVHINAVVLLDTLVIPNLLSRALPMAARTITDAFQNHATWVTTEQKVMVVIKCQNIQLVRLVCNCFWDHNLWIKTYNS